MALLAPFADYGEHALPNHATVSMKLLVVDDNRDSADSLALMLQMSGHETLTAYDGEEAVASAESFRPEAVLLDIGMPKMNGYDAARAIRGQPWGQDVLLFAITGWGQEEDRRRSREAGFNAHLVKPVEITQLMQLLETPPPRPAS